MRKLLFVVLAICFIFISIISGVYAIDMGDSIDYTNENKEIVDTTTQANDNNQENENEIDTSEVQNNIQQKDELLNERVDDKNTEDVNKQEANNNDDIDDEQLADENEISVSYSTHVEDIGWQEKKADGAMSGTEAMNKRLEGIRINLENNPDSSGITYSTHIQNIGWSEFVRDGSLSGTTGKALRLEAIKIKLYGDIADLYDVYYRVHVQNYGWLDWASNGKAAGSQSYGYRLEVIEIKLIKKGDMFSGETTTSFKSPGKVYYATHVEDIGWLNNVGDGKTSGTVGQSKRVEGLRIELSDLPYEGNIEYSSHIQYIGWQDYQKNGALSGTTGRKLRVEAMKVKLTGDLSNYYDVYYRVHAQNFGWLDWAKNNEKAGSEGFENRIEAIEIVLILKGNPSPGNTARPFIGMGNISYSVHVQDYDWMALVTNGVVAGTVGASKRLEAIKISLDDSSFNGNVEYSTHIQDIGWQNYVSNGEVSGTQSQSRRIEAIKIRLTGDIANYYNVYYRVHCQQFGWLDWASNNNISGTIGGSFRVEAVQIKLYPKGAGGPVNTEKSSISFVDKNVFKVCYDGNGKLCEDAESLIGKTGSYILRVNKGTNVVTVLVSNGEGVYNIAMKRFVCSVGNDTPIGTFYTPAKYRWKELIGPSYGQFSTRIVGGILFHSVPYNKMNNQTLSARMYNQLGTTCSHGCIRLTCGDAKWIYDNCPLRTRVDIVSGGVDPLSKPQAQKLPLSQTWDPTDPTI